jgi:hypothetical protein
MNMAKDGLAFKTEWTIGKFDDPTGEIAEMTRRGMSLQEAMIKCHDKFLGQEKVKGNIATTAGIKFVTYALAGVGGAPASANKFDSTNGYLCVGTGSGVAARANTAATFTSPDWVGPDATFPQLTDNGESGCVVKWQSTFGAGVATGDWNEFGLGNTNAGAVLFDRVVSAKGNKGAGETWILQLEITFA